MSVLNQGRLVQFQFLQPVSCAADGFGGGGEEQIQSAMDKEGVALGKTEGGRFHHYQHYHC